MSHWVLQSFTSLQPFRAVDVMCCDVMCDDVMGCHTGRWRCGEQGPHTGHYCRHRKNTVVHMPEVWSSRLWYAPFSAISLFRRLSLLVPVWYSYSKFIHVIFMWECKAADMKFPFLAFYSKPFHGLSSPPSIQHKQQHQQQQQHKKQKTNKETQKNKTQNSNNHNKNTSKQRNKPQNQQQRQPQLHHREKTLTINLKINMNHEPEFIVRPNSPPTPAAMHVVSNIAILTKREKGQHCPSKHSQLSEVLKHLAVVQSRVAHQWD